MLFVYVLQLTNGKYYVGKTYHPLRRIQEHKDGQGSLWTRKYKPLELVELKPNCDDYDEDKTLKQYMSQYGIDNVRGGSYIQFEIKENERAFIRREIQGSENKCFQCGEQGHFAKDCVEIRACIDDFCDDEASNSKLDSLLDKKITTRNINCGICGSMYENTEQNMKVHNSCIYKINDSKLMRHIRSNYNDLIINLNNTLISMFPHYVPGKRTMDKNGDMSLNQECPCCQKSFGKQKFLYYHILTNCSHTDIILNQLLV